ncbi:MAG TPA: hypothetical protein VFI41_03625 [Gemmatimonadales bacterium]|jgi:hypothetical protein|nr:hypothetical protein [Gemmatimonadales bacterium]
MAQHFLVDRRWAASYLAIALAACTVRSPVPTVAPDAPQASAVQVSRWVARTAPEAHQVLKFRWQIQDDRGAAGGRGSARVAAPDSVRLDVAGPLGSGRGAAVVVGDSAQWTDPPDIIHRLVPSYPLMWAMLGVMRSPPADAAARGLEDSTGVRWQWSSGTDTVRYALAQSGATLRAEARKGGELVGWVETTFSADNEPRRSQLVAPSASTKLTLTFSESESPDSFPPDLWRPPQP